MVAVEDARQRRARAIEREGARWMGPGHPMQPLSDTAGQAGGGPFGNAQIVVLPAPPAPPTFDPEGYDFGVYTVGIDCPCPSESKCDYSQYVEEAMRLLWSNLDLLPELFASCVRERLFYRGGLEIRLMSHEYLAREYNVGLRDVASYQGYSPGTTGLGPLGPLTLLCTPGSHLYQVALLDAQGASHTGRDYAAALGSLAETIAHEMMHYCGFAHDYPATDPTDFSWTRDLDSLLAARVRCSCWVGDPTNEMTSACLVHEGSLADVVCVSTSDKRCSCAFTCTGPGGSTYDFDPC